MAGSSRKCAAIAAGILILVSAGTRQADAALQVFLNLSFDQNGGAPPSAAVVANITNAMNGAAGVFNTWSDYTKTINVYYNSGVATADGNFNGTIRFGPSSAYHNQTVAFHELLHTLGAGTFDPAWDNNRNASTQWTGANGIAMSQHYYPSNTLMADNHIHWVGGGSLPTTENTRAGVHIMGAIRQDMGLSNGNVNVLSGDFNGDSEIDLTDYQTLRTYMFGIYTSLTPAQTYLRGDMNGDRQIDHVDFAAFREAYLMTGAGSFESLLEQVPEPSTAMFTAFAIIWLASSRTVRRNLA